MVRFNSKVEYEYILLGGPWMIVDHYLTVRQWQSNFHPKIASIDKVLIWIRIPNLPIEYYDKNFLLRLGSCIGRPIKVDEATL